MNKRGTGSWNKERLNQLYGTKLLSNPEIHCSADSEDALVHERKMHLTTGQPASKRALCTWTGKDVLNRGHIQGCKDQTAPRQTNPELWVLSLLQATTRDITNGFRQTIEISVFLPRAARNSWQPGSLQSWTLMETWIGAEEKSCSFSPAWRWTRTWCSWR